MSVIKDVYGVIKDVYGVTIVQQTIRIVILVNIGEKEPGKSDEFQSVMTKFSRE